MIVATWVLCYFAHWKLGIAELAAAQSDYGLTPAEFWRAWRAEDRSGWLRTLGVTLSHAGLHSGCVGVVTNSLVLWVFGGRLEMNAGSGRFTVFALLCVIGGCVTHAIALPDSDVPAIGGAALTAGAVAAYLVRHRKGRVTVILPPAVVHITAPWIAVAWIALQAQPVQCLLSRGTAEPLGYLAIACSAGVGALGSLLLWPRPTS